MPSFIHDKCCTSGENQPGSLKIASKIEINSSSTEISIDPNHIGQVETKLNHMIEQIGACSHWFSLTMQDGFGFYSRKNMTKQQSRGTVRC